MKIGIFSDLHLGKRQYGLQEREEDFYNQYDLAIKTFIDNDVSLVVCAGDLFDMPRPSPKTIGRFINGVKTLNKNGIPFVNIIGNHSMVQAPGFVTADELVEDVIYSDDYILLNKDNVYENSEVFIAGIPFTLNVNIDELKEEVSRKNILAGESDKPTILVLHQSFKEYCGFSGEELSIFDLDTSNFDLIVCGHIHERLLTEIDADTIFLQPGSLERCNLAEAKDEENQGKGVYIIDTEHLRNIYNISYGFAALKSDRRFIIADMYMKDIQEVEDIKNAILSYSTQEKKPPVLFLTVHDVSGSYQALIDMVKDIKKKCLTVHFNYMDENAPEYNGEIIQSADDIPSPVEALKIAVNPLDESERRFALDLYELLKDNKDATELVNNFYEQRKTKEFVNDYTDDELDEIISYFIEK